MKNASCKLSNKIIIMILVVLFSIGTFNIIANNSSIKYSDDYCSADLLKAQKIVLELINPTEEMIYKYDVNADGDITYVDIQIIQDMIIKKYDVYEIRNGKTYAIKYHD